MILVASWTGRASADSDQAQADLRPLLAAMRWVESKGNDRAIGRQGERGPYQITRAYWIDGGGDPARYELDVWSRQASERVILGYWRRYAAVELARRDYEALARCHNAGLHFRTRARRQSAVYWAKVRQRLQQKTSENASKRIIYTCANTSKTREKPCKTPHIHITAYQKSDENS